MQSVSADLAAAILAQERSPICRLLVDWDRDGSYSDADSDLSADVVSVDLSRELASDIPTQAKLFSGQAAATATVTLTHRDPAGDPAKHGAWYYSPLNASSPLFGYDRVGAPATLELGFMTASGAEYVTVLVGSVRSLQVQSGGRTAVMLLEDLSATFRRQVALPMVAADGMTASGTALRPALRTTWIASHIARACGYYPQPPARSSCIFLATMAGSAYPEIGTMATIDGFEGQQPGFEPTADHPDAAQWVMAQATAVGGTSEMRYTLDGSTSANNGGRILVEGWWRLRTLVDSQPLWIVFKAGGSGHYVSAYWSQTTGTLRVTFNRGGGAQNVVVGPSISPGTTDYHYIGIHVAFNSTGVTAVFRYDGATTSPAETATASIVSGSDAWDSIALDHGRVEAFADEQNTVMVEAVQVTTESSAGSWNDSFTPSADIVASAAIDARMQATPPATEEAWGLLQQVAAAEFATTGFDETGRFFYWPRDRWTTAPYTTSQRTLTPSTALKELETVEAIDQKRNHVIIPVTQVEVQAQTIVWWSVAPHHIPAAGRRLYCAFENPVANLDTSVVYGVTAGSSRYLASTRRNGLGTARSNLGFDFTVYAQYCYVDVDNPNAEQDYLVANSGSPGTVGNNYLVLEGQPVLFDQSDNTGMRAEASSGDADLLLELDANAFRQDLDMCEGLADDLLADLENPGPALSDVPAVGDPRIQLGDRLTIVDAEGLGLSADFHVAKIDLSFDGEGLGMVLSLRKA